MGKDRSLTVAARTYYRDSFTGLDYADQRYYANTRGRFLTPDPYRDRRSLTNPSAWNRYSYVWGDPINFADPAVLDGCSAEYGMPCYSATGVAYQQYGIGQGGGGAGEREVLALVPAYWPGEVNPGDNSQDWDRRV